MNLAKPSQKIFLPSSVLQDPTKEPLKVILSPYKGITHVPSDLGREDVATFVFVELQRCFTKAGNVAEGMLSNIIWGFEECGYDPRHVAAGLTQLRKLDYIFYSDERGNPIYEQNFDPNRLMANLH